MIERLSHRYMAVRIHTNRQTFSLSLSHIHSNFRSTFYTHSTNTVRLRTIFLHVFSSHCVFFFFFGSLSLYFCLSLSFSLWHTIFVVVCRCCWCWCSFCCTNSFFSFCLSMYIRIRPNHINRKISIVSFSSFDFPVNCIFDGRSRKTLPLHISHLHIHNHTHTQNMDS